MNLSIETLIEEIQTSWNLKKTHMQLHILELSANQIPLNAAKFIDANSLKTNPNIKLAD